MNACLHKSLFYSHVTDQGLQVTLLRHTLELQSRFIYDLQHYISLSYRKQTISIESNFKKLKISDFRGFVQ